MMKILSTKARLIFGACIVLLAIVLGALLYLADPIPLQLLRNATFDQFQRLQPRHYQDNPVRIIDIDDESLKRLGQWPWPRTKVAELIRRLQTTNPAAIALDIIFAESDRTSPQAMLDVWPLSPQNRQLLSHLPDHDRILADTISKGKVILGLALNHDASNQSGRIGKARVIEIGESPLAYLPSYNHAVTALPILEAAADGSGALSFVSDADGVIRKVPLLFGIQHNIVPSLVAESLRIAQQEKNITTRTHPENGIGIDEIRIGRYAIPTTPSGEVWIHFSPPVAERSIPAWQIFSDNVPTGSLSNRLLLIGTSAQGLMDQRFYPLGGVIPGIEIHAQALEQILSGISLTRPSWASALELLTIMAGGLLIGSVALSSPALIAVSVFLLALSALWLCAWLAFAKYHWLVDPTLPSLQLALVFVLSSIFRHMYDERRQRWIKQAFSRYISPNLVEHLILHPDALELGGRRQLCSFVFTDLTDFTALMEGMDPGNAVSLLNDYLENMIAIAFSHQGTLDRIVGDAVAIMFSAPVQQSDHQLRAIHCALAMQRFASQYCEELQAQGIAFGQTRIGVHSGEVIVGNFGGKTIFDYRALGDPVNTASRLEGANKQLGTLICVSEATLSACPQIQARPIGRILLKGKRKPIMTFEPLEPGTAGETQLVEYLAAYELMRQSHPDACAAFRHYIDSYPEDSLAVFHHNRLSQNQSGEVIELSEKIK